ncbi:response regulator transcription factor [Orrella daihaiensis]|uniref:Response regulator transcription factor n=1 Tax=Orrella daihaiensis TaxID=2782176 RepID=A0ABY4AI74_9BURK|nr:response regulator transcription factor [Orrella daihaiensis]UOD49793.1 response regulator transcription factor [Orrella daihaiensis]
MKSHHSVVIAAHSHLGFEAIAALINSHPDYSIATYQSDETLLIDTLQQHAADVLVMCYQFGNNGSGPTIPDIKQSMPDIAVVIVSAQPRDFETVCLLYQAGASAFLCSTTANQHALFNALEYATHGNNYYTNSHKDKLIETTVISTTTPITSAGNGKIKQEAVGSNLGTREKQVLSLIAQGHSAKEVARILHISKNTVEVHRRNIMIKLGLRKSTELTRYAIEHKLDEF